ncbi:MAG: helix-turn-helix domain-containing protein [Candidatus Latescibacterota bacterium]
MLSAGALRVLEGYDYPGNVRELKNVIERAFIHSRGGEILPQHLQLASAVPAASAGSPADAGPRAVGEEVPLNLGEAELFVVKRALARTEGNVAAAARLLGTSRTHVYRTLAREGRGPRFA